MNDDDRNAIFPVGVTARDLFWGAVGAVVGAALYAWIWPLQSLRAPYLAEEITGNQIYPWLLALLAFGGFGFFTAVLSLLDIREHRLPNGLLIWGNAWVILLLSLSSIVSGDLRQLALAWGCAAAFGLFMFLLWMRWQFHVGAGDVKLVPMAAFAAIWGSSGKEFLTAVFTFPFVMAAGTLLFAVIALINRRKEFPAGPVILGASWLTVVIHSAALGELLNR